MNPALTRSELLLLAAIGAQGSIAIHMFVPAMPRVAVDLHAMKSTIELAITLYLVGMGAGQLIAGPLADRQGRRPVLIAGLMFFTIGALGCAFSVNGPSLLGSRLIQALGAAASLVAVRAVVADYSARERAASRMATLMTVQLVSPAVSPMIGGLLAATVGWRGIFLFLAASGVLAVLACFRHIKIGPASPRPAPGGVLENYRRLVTNGRFVRFAAGIACASCALYIFLSASAFLLVDKFGLGTEQAGLCYFAVAAASISGTLLVGRLERLGGAFRLGLLAIVMGAVTLLGLTLAGASSIASLIAPMLLVGLGGGIAAPAGIAGAMHAEDGLAATGASLAGALQMIASGVTTSIIAQIRLGTTLGMAGAILAVGLIGLAVAPRGRAA